MGPGARQAPSGGARSPVTGVDVSNTKRSAYEILQTIVDAMVIIISTGHGNSVARRQDAPMVMLGFVSLLIALIVAERHIVGNRMTCRGNRLRLWWRVVSVTMGYVQKYTIFIVIRFANEKFVASVGDDRWGYAQLMTPLVFLFAFVLAHVLMDELYYTD